MLFFFFNIIYREHKVELRNESEFEVDQRHKDQFALWFKRRVSTHVAHLSIRMTKLFL